MLLEPAKQLSSRRANSQKVREDSNNEEISISKSTSISRNESSTSSFSSSGALSFSGSTIKHDGVKGMNFDDAANAVIQYFQSANAPTMNLSTISVPHAQADLLYELDRISQSISQSIVAHQREFLEGTPIIFSEYNRTMGLHRIVGLSELQRYRRQFVNANFFFIILKY